MNLKWLFWTGLLATVVFFGVTYFGIKYNWVGDSQHNPSSTKLTQQSTAPKTSHIDQPRSEASKHKRDPGSGITPELIDEVEPEEPSITLGSSDLTIEEIVTQCQQLSASIGVPEQKLEQSISECIDRNSLHLTTGNKATASDRDLLIKEQCNVAITHKELLSSEEIKMLVDECVASMR